MESQLSKTYQKKTDIEHVRDNPDTYIGSVTTVTSDNWMFNEEENRFTFENHDYVAGLYKLFDECMVNARDHVIRCLYKDYKVTYINVEVSADGIISITNDGQGIDVIEHPEYKIYIPEMIFGHMRTSTNYDKSEKKIVGGKNGFGVKLVFIWSTWGKIETIDQERRLKYSQEFHNNLDKIDTPVITKCSKKPYTKISFKPDYVRMGISHLNPEMIQLFKRRVYDIAAVTHKKIKVKWNNELVEVKDFQDYIRYYIGDKVDTPRVYEKGGDRWEYCVTLTKQGEYTQVSFVNGIFTNKGGKHVEYITNQIIKKMVLTIKKKKKIDVKPSTLKEQMMIFVNAVIENPCFDSQTKDYMTTPVGKFGSTCEVSDRFVDKLAGIGIMDMAISLTELKDTKQNKKTDGSKTKSIRGIPKLIDANFAGTSKSNMCTLILCEGDSAKAGVVSGLSKDDRNLYGVYPMRGKLLNVRDETIKKIGENKEINEIKQILGLESDKEYTEEEMHSCLRYSKVLFMTDQDLDGSHIKGLGINMFDSLWRSLLKIPNFLGFMNTPIIKATKGGKTLLFYNDGEYDIWKQQKETGWVIKYYKGLGTSTGKEFKEYFKEKKMVYFKWEDTTSVNSLDKVFNKKRADDRKDWLGEYNRKHYLDTNQTEVSYDMFVDREMRHFSKHDCERSIPSMVDGFKTSQRKTMYAAFKRNMVKEIKVAQFSGYVSENSAYHHGEASLNGTIIGLAQDYVGSNNINLFLPKGQFGTRMQGGKDHASERYIYTCLNKITRNIFSTKDDGILTYLDDDGFSVEPIFYLPIIPMLLVNGSKGIGTGFSTDIPSFNPSVIIEHLQGLLIGKPCEKELIPYYRGFKGTIEKVVDIPGKYMVRGIYEKINSEYVVVTELPIGIWIDDYKAYLETIIENKKRNIIRDYEDTSTDKDVKIKIRFAKGVMDSNGFDLEKTLKMVVSKNTHNMHMFDDKERLKKYTTPLEIIHDFYDIRLGYYEQRRLFCLKESKERLSRISNKVKYINGVLDSTIDLRNKNENAICILLESRGLEKMDDNYHYLTKMTMDSVSQENIVKLLKDETQLKKEYDNLNQSTANSIWLKELDELNKML